MNKREQPVDTGGVESLTDRPPRGLLDPTAGQGIYREAFLPSSTQLADVVANHWAVRWDLRGEDPYVVEVLPGPEIQLVVEAGAARVHGILGGKFTYELRDTGDIFGTTFRPAGFRCVYGRPIAELGNRVVDGSEIFGAAATRFANGIASKTNRAERIDLAEEFVRQRQPDITAMTRLVNEIVDTVADDRSIVRVDDIAERFGVGQRNLQKLFREHVGMTPKRVLQRYRLHEAAERLDNGSASLAALAADLGYADQAHFARDFKAIVGRPPASYTNR